MSTPTTGATETVAVDPSRPHQWLLVLSAALGALAGASVGVGIASHGELTATVLVSVAVVIILWKGLDTSVQTLILPRDKHLPAWQWQSRLVGAALNFGATMFAIVGAFATSSTAVV